jgi:hypothetical protein
MSWHRIWQVKKTVANLKLFSFFIFLDASPYPTFDFDANLDPDPTRKFYICWKIRIFLLLFTAVQFLSTLFYLPRQRHRFENFNILNSILKYSGKSIV